MTISTIKNNLINAVNRVVLGKEEITKLIVISMLCKGHVLLEDYR